MEKDFGEVLKKVRTREELISLLEEIEKEKLKKDETVSKLEKNIQSLQEIRLEIAFPPSNDFIEKISQWLETEFSQKVILDIIVNPKIVAGAIIEYQGKWRDFSLAKKISQLISEKISHDRF